MDVILTTCVEKNGSLLVVQEAKEKALGLWNLPSGHLKQNEDVFEGAIREAREETGFDVELVSLLSIHNYIRQHKPILRIVFIARTISDNGDFNRDEIMDVKWIPISELENMEDKLRSSESFKDIIQDIKNGVSYPLIIVKNIIGTQA